MKLLAVASENAGEFTCGLNAESLISQSLSSSLKFISVSAIALNALLAQKSRSS